MNHELAVDRVSMTYSWHNVNSEYGNKTIKYSKDNGSTWKTITFVDGMYSYDDLSDYINGVISHNDDQPSNNRVGIKIYFVLSSYRVVVELGNQWQLDMRNSTFGDLIGFNPQILTTTRAGHFKISSGISKPRHVFVFIINDADINSQTSNPFLYNTLSVSTNPRTLQNCHLEVANGQEYPEVHYTPSTELSRVYRDVLKYVHKNSEFSEGLLLNLSNFQLLFPFIYFDLTKQKEDVKDGTTKLTFRYELSSTTATAYSVYALTLYEQEAELVQQNGKLLFR